MAVWNPPEPPLITHQLITDTLDRLLLLTAEARAAYDYENHPALASCLQEIMWLLDNCIPATFFETK